MPKIIESQQDAEDVLEMLTLACIQRRVQLLPGFTQSGRKVHCISIREVEADPENPDRQVASLMPTAVLIENTDDVHFSADDVRKAESTGLTLVQGGKILPHRPGSR